MLFKAQQKSNDEIIINICKVIVLVGLLNSVFFFRDIFSAGISLSGINLRGSPIYGYVPIGLFSHKVSTATISALSLISSYVLYFKYKQRKILLCMVVFTIMLVFSSSFKELIIISVIYFISFRALYSDRAKASRASANLLLGSLLVVPVFSIFFW